MVKGGTGEPDPPPAPSSPQRVAGGHLRGRGVSFEHNLLQELLDLGVQLRLLGLELILVLELVLLQLTALACDDLDDAVVAHGHPNSLPVGGGRFLLLLRSGFRAL